jgi:predicted CoA-binding protein
VELQQGENVIWKDYSLSSYRRNLLIGTSILGAILLLTVIFAVLGIVIIAVSVTTYILTRRANEYVVTNKRAMHVKFGKVWKQVDLSTPGLVVSTVNPRTYSSRFAGEHVVQDVVFIVNGVEVLRFSKTSKGDELMAKLHSLGFQ